MTKRITAAKAYQSVTKLNVFEQAEANRMTEVVKMTKTIRARRPSVSFGKAVLIAKRAYRMGVRSVFAN